MNFFLFFIICMSLNSQSLFAQLHTITIEITNISSAKGNVLLSLFNQADGFPSVSKKALVLKEVKAVKGKVEVKLENMPAGTYAVACFHDANADGELNTNLVGLPKERYGFSNGARPGYRAANWREAAVPLPDGGKLSVTLK